MELKGAKMMHSVLREQYLYVMKWAKKVHPEDLKGIIEDIPTERLDTFLHKYYKMAAPLAMLQRNYALGKKFSTIDISKKDSEDDYYFATFEAEMENIIKNQSGELIKTITGTTKENMLRGIREILNNARDEGLGVPAIQDLIVKKFGEDIIGNAAARARAIARTEMIKASNQAQHFAMKSTKLQYRKFWSTSHLGNIRDSHMEAEQDSIDRGGLQPNELHSNGLAFVGDPSAPAEEIINCRCTELYETI